MSHFLMMTEITSGCKMHFSQRCTRVSIQTQSLQGLEHSHWPTFIPREWDVVSEKEPTHFRMVIGGSAEMEKINDENMTISNGNQDLAPPFAS